MARHLDWKSGSSINFYNCFNLLISRTHSSVYRY